MAKTFIDLAQRQRQEPDWIVPGLLKRQNILFMIGQPKKAVKSWLLINMAWDLSEGKPLFGISHSKLGSLFVSPRPMRVIYFAQEDTEDDLQDRIELMRTHGNRIPNDNLWYVSKDLNQCFDTEDGLGIILQHIKEASPIDLIIFDPMRRLHYSDENDSKMTAKLWRSLDALSKKFNCSVCFSHHTVKPPRDDTYFDETSPFVGRGSGDIFGGGDAFMTIVPKAKRGNPELVKSQTVAIHFETKRAKPLTPILVSVSFETGLAKFEGFGTGKKRTDDNEDKVPTIGSQRVQ